MAFVFNQGSRGGVPIACNFTYGGVAVNWGTNKLLDMGNVSCRAEPLDGKFSVSELSVSFSDTDGSIWGSLGHGTSGLGSSWSATVSVGGNMSEQTYGPTATRLARANLTDANVYTVHTGRISEISRKDRTVEIVSRNAMSQVENLEWVFPVNGVQAGWSLGRYGSNFFQTGNTATVSFQNRPAFFNIEEVNETDTKFEGYAFIGPSVTLTSAYPTPTGRGTLGALTGSGFFYPGTQFYYDYTRVLFKGTYMATYTGSITTDAQANSFGYAQVSAAEAAKVGGTYELNRTRLTISGDVPTNLTGSYINWQQVLTLGSTPAYLWQEMLTGCCVTPLFGSSTIDGDTLAVARLNTAFQFHQQTIDPKGGKVLPYIKNMLEPLRALWSVSSNNTFRLYTFGPKNYTSILATIGTNEITDSSVTSSIADKYNRLSLKYGYIFETGSYSKKLDLKASGWGSLNDYPMSIDSQWLNNDNDAEITGLRILSRYSKGQPKLSIKVPLTRLTADVGSLYAIHDPDHDYTSKAFEVVGWHKDFVNDRSMRLELWDGDTLYRTKGYGKWEGDASLTAPVTSNSTFGWSDGVDVANINTAFYGNFFVWF